MAIKTFSLALFTTLLVVGMMGCKKTTTDQMQVISSSCTSPPAPVVMVLLNKKGNNLVLTATDKVVISYSENGQIQTIACMLESLVDATTRQPTTKYTGMAVGCDLGSYSVRQTNPIKTFQVTVNSQVAGTIYYDLQPNIPRNSIGIRDCFKVISFQLNTVPVQTDDTVMPYAAVLTCNL